MKKKLIAIVASLAMVATMVPATAFAGAGGNSTSAPAATKGDAITVPNAGGTISLSSGAPTDRAATEKGWLVGTSSAYEQKTTNWKFSETVTGDYKDGKLTLKGIVPWTTKEFDPKVGGVSIYDNAEKAGHYVGMDLRVLNPQVTGVAGWAFSYSSNEKATDGTAVTGDTIQKLYTYNKTDFSDYDEYVLRNLDVNPTTTFTVYYLTTAGINTFAKYSHNYAADQVPFEALFGDAKYTGAGKNATKEPVVNGTPENITLNAVINEAKDVNGIAATQTLTVDTAGLTKLSEDETESINMFIEDVDAIHGGAVVAAGDTVDKRYIRDTERAEATYNALGTAKSAVDAIANDKDIANTNTVKAACKELKQAQKNVEAFAQLDAVAELIAALPDAATFDLTDTAAVKQVNKAKAAVTELTDGAKEVLMDVTEGYLTKKEKDNYDALVKKVGDTAVKSVIDMVNALKKPTAFTDKASVDAISTPLLAADKAYRSLDSSDRAKVDSETSPTLPAYKASYNTVLVDYVDPIWEKAAKIDTDQPLSEENIALVQELQAYVEGDYLLDTDDLTNFRPATYDALIAALGNEYDLAEATVAVTDAENIVYDGTKKTPAVTVTDKAGKEIAADNYTVIYSDNKDAGEATVTVAAKGATYTGSATATFTIKPAALTADMVKVANATYTGKALKPAVSVASGVDYTVAYKNNTAVGKAAAVVTGTGNYTGTITKNFIVKPAKESITSLKAGKKQITVAYKAQTGAKYRVICKASGLKAIGTNTTATKKTVKKLKSGKTYQVKVRAYKAVDGTTYYGAYSAVKKVKVK